MITLTDAEAIQIADLLDEIKNNALDDYAAAIRVKIDATVADRRKWSFDDQNTNLAESMAEFDREKAAAAEQSDQLSKAS